MTIDTIDLIKALEERKRQLSKWTDKDRAKERIDEINCIIDTDVPYLVKEESEKPVTTDLEEAAEKYRSDLHKIGDDIDEEGCMYRNVPRDAFIAGAEWQAERLLKGSPMPEDTVIFQKGIEEGKRLMLEDAVEGKVFMSFAPGHNQMVMADVDLPTNTKVKIVIVKEEQK